MTEKLFTGTLGIKPNRTKNLFFKIQKFMFLNTFCDCAVRFVSELVGNSDDRYFITPFIFRQRIYTRLPGGSPCIKMVIYTAALQDIQQNRLNTRLPGVNIKLLFTRQPFQGQLRYIHGCHTRRPGGSPCIKMVIYTAALQDFQQNRLNTRLPGVNIKLLFTRQPFQSQLRYIYGCYVFTYANKVVVIYTTAGTHPTQNDYSHGSRSHAIKFIYTAALHPV